MKFIYISTVFLFLFFIVPSTNVAAQNSERNDFDRIRIINVTAAAPVTDGVENEFTVELEYTLDSADEAMVGIGFNSEKPAVYKMTTNKKIKRGTNLIALKAVVKPKDWKERGDFIIYANLAPYPIPQARFTPLATTKTVIDFER